VAAVEGNEVMANSLSPRQLQILRLIAVGASDKEIAGRLGIAVPTVRTHLQRLYRDCCVRNRAEAVAVLLIEYGGHDRPGDVLVVDNDVITLDD
jgi:DNA-binding NarL/FixJ family response regulator